MIGVMPGPRPAHLTPENAAAFRYESVASAYRFRPPYPDEVFAVLGEYFGDRDAVLDLGCGSGDVARPLASRAARVDAVDPSEAMIAIGRTLPGGDHPKLAWHVSTAEEFGYPGPYALIVAPLSLQWMDWPRVFPRMRAALEREGRLAVIHRRTIFQVPWGEGLRELVPRYSTMKNFVDHDLVEDLRGQGYFEMEREVETHPVTFRQAVDDYLASWHSRAGFCRERMGTENAEAFAAELRRLVQPFADEGQLTLDVVVRMAIGRPACEAV
jgi:trans-aconitate methyltransferase